MHSDKYHINGIQEIRLGKDFMRKNGYIYEFALSAEEVHKVYISL